MIFIALGANLPSRFGSPERTIEVAQTAMERRGIRVLRASRVLRTAPVPVSDQPWYYNAVVSVETALSAIELLQTLQEIEIAFGRKRSVRNEARVLDLDLIAYHDEIVDSANIQVPHPRMHERGFVLYPLKEVAPHWQHPVLGLTIDQLIVNLPSDQQDDQQEKPSQIEAA